jgi:nitrate reductase delta subunit
VLFSALLNLIQANVDMEAIQREVNAESRDDSPDALDKVWEDEIVTFGADKAQPGGIQSEAREIRIPVEAIQSARRKQ